MQNNVEIFGQLYCLTGKQIGMGIFVMKLGHFPNPSQKVETCIFHHHYLAHQCGLPICLIPRPPQTDHVAIAHAAPQMAKAAAAAAAASAHYG